MKCYKCKREITMAVRRCLPDKKGNERFRDLCNDDQKSCYKEHMDNEGYELVKGIWQQR